ncbi:MAG: DNA topoisomerase III [Peptococcaceae bacterium BRH_c4b]|nr:MAG: DNA topoisomerase III [Peptococcaceae bacterium BRH_c4b]
MKSLILAEKPSVARDLAAIIGKFNNRDGYMENSEYVVTWAIGHLVELAAPEDYSPGLKKWTIGSLPIIPEKFRLKPNPKTVKQLKVIRELLRRSDVDSLVNACDAGREGELIFRYIYHIIGCKKPFKRLWLSETTPAAVKKAFTQLRPGSNLDLLARAAEARSRADWLIGINATRAFTVRHNNLLSVGRVQTPTLALIVNREQEINNFVSVPYWELYAVFNKDNGQSYTGKWFKEDQDRFDNPAAAKVIQDEIAGKPAVVVSVEQKAVTELPPLLFNLNDLQKEANKKYGLAAAKTLEIAQALYEKRKLITYPRTDSRHITKELASTIGRRLAALAGTDEYAALVKTAKEAGMPGKRYVDDGKVTDHTALLPTDTKPDKSALTPDERKIYDLVARRFLAIFFPPARYKQTRVITKTEGETFLTTGRVELDPGWKTVYTPAAEKPDQGEDTESDEIAVIPELTRGENVVTDSTKIKEKQTKPPKRYTEAMLLAAMEGAGRFMENSELKKAMKGHGLGTSATRAAIIERLIQVGYIERKQKILLPTTKGISLINLVPDIIKSPEMTGQWEKSLADIELGKVNPRDFMAGIINITRQTVEVAKQQAPTSKPGLQGRESLGKCPVCSRDVVEYPKSYGCTGYKEGCKFAIWKEISGKKITPTQAKLLLNQGKTGIIKGFLTKEKNKFDAVLVVREDGKIIFQ